MTRPIGFSDLRHCCVLVGGICSLLPLLGILLVSGQTVKGSPANAQLLVYVGTYTGKGSDGIYLLRLDTASSGLTSPVLAAETPNPTFLALHPNHRYLYAANEIGRFDGKKSGAVSGFAVEPGTGKLTFLNQEASGGDGPCHLVVDRTGKYVLLANYGGGSVAVLPIQGDGRLGTATSFVQHTGSGSNPQRQEGPHAHSINVDAANRFAVAADLGLDKLLVYRFNSTNGTLTPNDPPFVTVKPGSGPRHFAFHPQGRFAYAINEMGSTVTVFAYDGTQGTLKEVQTISTLPKGFKGENDTAEVQVHPSGKFLYGSNRGHDSIAVFSIDKANGKLSLIQNESTQGKTPRNFGIDPSGRILLAANQDSGNVVAFRIDPRTGRLSPTGQSVKVNSPVCVKFLTVE